MTWYPSQPWRAWLRHSLTARPVLLALLAFITLAGPLWANVLLWPVEYLGYNIDPVSGLVTFVEPASTAAAAGLQIGDQLLQLYGAPWADAVTSWNQWQLIEQSGPHIAVVVQRDGIVLSFELPRRSPDFSYQIAKIIFMLLAAACWITGALLGFGRQHEVNGSQPIAAFWLTLAGLLGIYLFAVDLCIPLLVALLWLIVTILPGLCIGVHVWFPARAVSARRSRWARWLILGSWMGGNGLLAAALFLWRPTLPELLLASWLPVVVALVVSFLGSGLLLVEAYWRVTTPHVRRQLRLIFAASLFAAGVWFVFRLAPLLLGVVSPLPDAIIDLTVLLIPLAYLVSGTATSLYTFDRLLRRVLSDLLTVGLTALLFGAAVLLATSGPREVTLWWALMLGALLLPVAGWARRLRTQRGDPDRSYAPLRQARHKLTTSLEPAVLREAIRDGVQSTFQRPAFALYCVSHENDEVLQLVQQDRLPDLPQTLANGTLTEKLLHGAPIVEARALHAALQTASLTLAEEDAVRHQGVALWGVMRQGEDKILALALIGTDGGLEPYRAEDRRELLALLDAAGLALAHSTAFERLRHTERVLRDLFHAMRRVQDETIAGVARDIHDEILNMYVQLNIISLQHLLKVVAEPAQRSELAAVLQSEQNVSQRLRRICERLYPEGLDDPLGLEAVLTGEVNRIRAAWSGSCRLLVSGEPIPLAQRTLLEVYRISREALTNAAKHAQATRIEVALTYLPSPNELITVSVTDDGRVGMPVRPRAGHWGVRNMQESARSIGATLSFQQPPSGGTEVLLRFPASFNELTELSIAELVHEVSTTWR